MVEAFVDKPDVTQWYEEAFATYEHNGVESMRWYWSWWAFFGGFLFLLYRKQYVAALVLFLLSTVASAIPFGGFIVMILSGGYATYFIYKGYKEKRAQIEAAIDDEAERIETMRRVGGYHQWVVWIYVVMALLFWFGVAVMLFPLLPDPDFYM